MRVYKYKTLRGLMGQAAHNQVNLYDVKNGQCYLKNRGWRKVEISDELREKLYLIFAGAIYEKEKNIMECAKRLPRVTNEGIFKRVHIDGNMCRASYCAGQDYDSEIRLIQRLTYK